MRPEIQGAGICIGCTVSKARQFQPVIHSVTTEFSEVTSKLLKFAHDHFLPKDFLFSSVQLFDRAEVALHQDGNVGPSITVAIGVFTGGELVIDDIHYIVHNAPLHYDGRIPHRVARAVGARISLTFFVHPKCTDLSDDDHRTLTKLGFRLPIAVHAASCVEGRALREGGRGTHVQKAVITP